MDYKYCPKCEGFLKKVFLLEEGHKRLKCQKCGFVFYLNSKPTASTLIIKDSQILLGKRIISPSKGDWDVIGGFLEPGEHPEDGARREAMEETGLEIEILNLLVIVMDKYGNDKEPTLNICYTARIKGGKLRPSDDIGELHWFDVKRLPKNIAFKNGRKMLEVWRKKLSQK